jgi:hypothetical protein
MGAGSSIADTITNIFKAVTPNMPSLPPVDLAFMSRVFNLLETNLTDSPLFTAMLDELKDVYKVHQVAIEGDFGKFSTYNFDITKPRFNMMSHAGWKAAIDTIEGAVRSGHFPPDIVRDQDNPY